PGILLGFVAAFTGIGAYIMLKLFKEEPIIGLATGSTAGNAVATPAAVAAADPTLAVIATVATAQVAAACVVSDIICPFIVTTAFKLLSNYQAKKANAATSQAEVA
ncbi:MAG: 2-keto-3-deoxygluconate permease, partial [Firmicutes bacterium HGW-Firmicutes-17]